MEEAIKAAGDDGKPFDWLFLAMAHHRRRRPQEARKWLDKSVAWIEKAKNDQASGASIMNRNAIRVSDDELIEIQVLLNEAEALIVPKP
ncbi:MAG: hypothetical protein ACHRXM_21710 [Isosphaerales bacterium]